MTQTDSPLIAEDLCLRFGRHQVLDHLSLRVQPNGVTVLLGRNGAGKSSLLRIAIGAQPADRGRLRVVGCDPTGTRARQALRRQVGYVPDVPDAPAWMTLAEWLRFLAPHYPAFDRALAAQLAARFEVPLAVPFSGLSRGQGMLGMWIAAVAFRPRLVLLDEPFSGLDPLARDAVLRAVIEELREDGATIVITTHDLEMTARIADHVAVLADGRIALETDLAALADDNGSLPDRLRIELQRAVATAPAPHRPIGAAT